jgi:hypothetical protein
VENMQYVHTAYSTLTLSVLVQTHQRIKERGGSLPFSQKATIGNILSQINPTYILTPCTGTTRDGCQKFIIWRVSLEIFCGNFPKCRKKLENLGKNVFI